MKNTKANIRKAVSSMAIVLSAVLCMLLLLDRSALQVQAETPGKVTAATANIRKEADAGSTAIASVVKDDSISIKAKTTGADGKVWYQIYVDANTLGFIRSDLVSVSGEVSSTLTPGTGGNTAGEGTTGGSNSGGSTGTGGNAGTPDDIITAEITALNPLGATVTGGQVRVRKNCSTTSSIVTTVANGVVVTVTGQAVGKDNKTWYQVSFIADGAEVTGFIRSDFLILGEEPVPLSENAEPQPGEEEPGGEEIPVEVPEEPKDYEISYVDGTWSLLDNVGRMNYEIPVLLKTAEENANALEKSLDKVGKQSTTIMILAVIIIILVAVLVLGILKFKDELLGDNLSMREDPVIRRRPTQQRYPAGQNPTGQRPAGSGQRRPGSGQGGTQRPAGEGQTRPLNQRPTGASQTRPTGQGAVNQRPTGNPGSRPAGQGPVGQRPTGQGPTSQRSTGQGNTGQRPPSQNLPGNSPVRTGGQGAQRPQGSTGQRPQTQGQRPSVSTDTMAPAFDMTDSSVKTEHIRRETEKSLEDQHIQRTVGTAALENVPERKAKNFMTDDEEFEFEFLNWDGEEI